MKITFYYAPKNGILASIIEHIPHNQKKKIGYGEYYLKISLERPMICKQRLKNKIQLIFFAEKFAYIEKMT